MVGPVAAGILGEELVVVALQERAGAASPSSSSPSRRKRCGKHQRVKEAQKLLEKHDPQ